MNTVELYWNDLTEEAQKRILAVLGDNGNYDVFPIVTIYAPSDNEYPEDDVREDWPYDAMVN